MPFTQKGLKKKLGYKYHQLDYKKEDKIVIHRLDSEEYKMKAYMSNSLIRDLNMDLMEKGREDEFITYKGKLNI